MKQKNTRLAMMLGTAFVASAAFAASAAAQTFDGTYSGPVTSTTVVGSSTTETSGDSSVAPFQNTTTTYTNETVTSDLPTQNAVLNTTVNGTAYTGSIDYSGNGGQAQIHETSITNTYNPGPPPSVSSTTVNPDVITPVGAPTVTAVSASGSIGDNPNSFSAQLSTSGPVVDGSVTATENSVVTSASGVSYTQRVGTATYNPGTGDVTVALPTAPTSSTSISAAGISTTGDITTAGTVSASGFNANGGRITGVGDALTATDAVNLGQVNNIIAANSSVLRDLIDTNRRRADAGTAVAVALGGGVFLPNKTFNFTANIGGYRSEAAIAAQVGYLVNENVALNAGVAKGFTSRGATAWRGGFSVGF